LTEYIRTVSKKNIKKTSNESYEVRDTHNGLVAIARQKHFLFGLTNCNNKQTRQKMMKELSVKLSKGK
jgi:hypothetical protein